jgi:hypothetical protein
MKDITLNFGAIRDSVTRLSSMELLKENSNNSLKTFIDIIKKSPVLLKQHYVFKNFEDSKPFIKERLAERFINQNLSILKGIKWQDIINENKKIRISLLENSHVESNGGKKDELFNHIHTLIESVTKPTFSNIQAEQEAYEFLLEYLTRPVSQENISKEKIDNPNLKNWKYITKLAVNNFNERYSHLNEEEKKILGMFLSDDNKKINYIEDLKKENLSLIDNLLKECKDIEKIKVLKEFREKLNKVKNFDSFSADDFIISYSELKNNLKTM